jgi:hypothetical protein
MRKLDTEHVKRGYWRGAGLAALHLTLGVICAFVAFAAWAKRVNWDVMGSGYEAPTATGVKIVFFVCLGSYFVAALFIARRWWARRTGAWVPSIVWFVASLIAVFTLLSTVQPAGHP